jgi:hypothetical protein
VTKNVAMPSAASPHGQWGCRPEQKTGADLLFKVSSQYLCACA